MRTMSPALRTLLPLVALSALLPAAALAEPITLTATFFSSDRSAIYSALIKPFVEAVNQDGPRLIEFEVHFSGAFGKGLAQQPQLVSDGVADIALIAPGYDEKRFPDNAVMELPGLFRDAGEAGSVYGRLIAARAVTGFDDYYVIG